jgi:CopG family transcriptional regulator / antitoxin EndoAI
MERIIVSLPHELLEEIDELAVRLEVKRSRVVREALGEWILRQRQREHAELMAEGYQDMATRSSSLSREEDLAQVIAAEGVWTWDDE